jgi:hydrogenase maturation protease
MYSGNSADQQGPGISGKSGTSARPDFSGVLVVGLGNPILGDDGIGWAVAEQVAASEPTVEVECLALGGLSLMERLIGYRHVIIVDSIQTESGRVGDVTRFSLSALPDRSAGHTTAAHDTSLQTALALGRSMGAQLPDDVTIVAVEADRVYDFSDQLSPPVLAAVPEATRLVLEALESLTQS